MFHTKKENLDILTFPVQPLGCNCSIIICRKTKEAIIVDPGGEAEKIKEVVKNQNCVVKSIIHTHAHFDHCLATHEVALSCSSEDNAVQIGLHPDDLFLYDNLEKQCEWFGVPPQKALSSINHRLSDEEEIFFGEEKLQILHTPGHTPGSCCFNLGNSGLLFSGDTLFERGVGRYDLPGGDGPLLFESIKNRLFTLDEETDVIPGHGNFTRIYEEKNLNPYF